MTRDSHDVSWPPSVEVQYSSSQREQLQRIRSCVERRLSGHRLRHVLGVAETARWLAVYYGVDPFEAELAGLLHDWDKKLDAQELWEKARGCHVAVPDDERLTPLLHAWTAAASLPAVFPDLPPAVFRAIGRHTVGDVAMEPLDMVVYIADMIEPGRCGSSFDELRAWVAQVDLPELFALCHRRSIAYLLEQGRYVYPGAIDVWNVWCARLPVETPSS